MSTGEKLDKIYYCADCEIVFLFQSDVENHTAGTGHTMIGQIPFDSSEVD